MSDSTIDYEVHLHEDLQHFEDVVTTSAQDGDNHQIQSSSSFLPLQIDGTGDHRYAVQESREKMSYIPTPENRLTWSFSPLSLRADGLLRIGCMPLLPPARRNWSKEEQIALPEGFPMTRWPPKGWSNLTTDVKLLLLETRDVIRSPDIRTFESRSEVRTQFQYPEVRKNIKIVQKCTISFRKYFRIITQRGNMTRTSDFADENTTIGDNCHRCVFV